MWIAAIKQATVQAWIPDYIATGLRADGLLVLKKDNMLVPYFVEAQRVVNASPFDKVEKYTALFESKSWCKEWWVQKTEDGRPRFPAVLILTDGGQLHKRRLEAAIADQNHRGLRFVVITLEELLEGGWC